MKIEGSKRPQPSLRSTALRLWRRGRLTRAGLFLIYSAVLLSLGYWVHVRTPLGQTAVGRTLWSWLQDVDSVPRRLRALALEPEVERLVVSIGGRHVLNLAEQRNRALARGALVVGDDDYVPARIEHGGRTLRAKLRLKGDSVDHLQGDKWSYRIRVRGDDALLGMKQLSLQHPGTRHYLYEWVYHRALQREGLPALRYDFVTVSLNGRDLGVYALEEHFEKRLVEHNRLREGPIVRLSEDMLWSEQVGYSFASDYLITSFRTADIDTFQTNKALSDPSAFSQHARAIGLLEAFRREELATSEVFDVDKLARYFAISDLLGAQHSVNWSNLRFYYNPVTSRLEPIGFDGDAGRWIRSLSSGLAPLVDPLLIETVFGDLEFFEAYVAALERVSEPAYLDELLAEIDAELQTRLDLLYGEFPDLSYSPAAFRGNARFIRNVLNPIKGLHAYYRGVGENGVELELGSIQSIPVEVLGATGGGQPLRLAGPRRPLPGRQVYRMDGPAGRRFPSSDPVEFQIRSFQLPGSLSWSPEMAGDLKVQYRLLGTSRLREERVFPWPFRGDPRVADDLFRQKPNPHAFEFLDVDESERRISVRRGAWTLAQDLILPEGFRITARGGTLLDLSGSAKIVSYSPLEFVGTEEDPIVVRSSDSTGQGIAVLEAGGNSVLRHVTFENLAEPAEGGWSLTGAVTFYESPVSISDTRFLDSRSEDALNVIRSQFSVERAVFSGSRSDAIDVDFSRGSVENSRFVASGNDAIDASGSVMSIHDAVIHGAGDKGISAGEASEVVAGGIRMRDVRIGVASKDLSRVSVRQLSLTDSEVGLAAYQKKAEFGPASLVVEGLEVSGVQRLHLAEQGSELVVEGKRQEAGASQVAATLATP